MSQFFVKYSCSPQRLSVTEGDQNDILPVSKACINNLFFEFHPFFSRYCFWAAGFPRHSDSTDFLIRFRKHKHTEQHQLKLAKYLVLGTGVAVVLISSLMDLVPGNILAATNKTGGLFIAPLFGLFFLALFVPFSNAFGGFLGAIYGFLTAFVIAYWDVITGQLGLSFQLIIPVSLIVNITAGCLLSLLYLWCKKNLLAKIACYVVAILPIVVGLIIIIACYMLQGLVVPMPT